MDLLSIMSVHCLSIMSVHCPSVNTYSVRCDMSTFSGRILMKLGTSIHHVHDHCQKGFQGHRSKVKVIARSGKICPHTSVLSGGISLKLARNNRHVSGNC